jgi:hypothetical protein
MSRRETALPKPKGSAVLDSVHDALMAPAKKNSWSVISMKNDWKRIFAFEK